MSTPVSGTSGDNRNVKKTRLEHPSGLLYLFQHDAVPIFLDALLDLPPGREFNKTEFADHSGLTRQTVANYVDLLLEVEIIENVPNTTPQRYRLADSDVVQELFELNAALNATSE